MFSPLLETCYNLQQIIKFLHIYIIHYYNKPSAERGLYLSKRIEKLEIENFQIRLMTDSSSATPQENPKRDEKSIRRHDHKPKQEDMRRQMPYALHQSISTSKLIN